MCAQSCILHAKFLSKMLCQSGLWWAKLHSNQKAVEALTLCELTESTGTCPLKYAKICDLVCSAYLKIGVIHKLVISIAAFECCI